MLVGHSVGGYLAYLAQLILNKLPIKSILLAPVLDLQRTEDEKINVDVATKFIGGPTSSRKDIDPFQIENYPEGDLAIIQGTRDSQVPFDFTKRYIDKYNRDQPKKCKIRYIELPNIGHFELINPKCEEILSLVLKEILN